MKAKLLILGLFCWFGTFAQSVPNTTTFALSDVTSVVTGIGSNDLVECFAHAVDAYFDPTYKGSKNNLYNFRHYRPTFLSAAFSSYFTRDDCSSGYSGTDVLINSSTGAYVSYTSQIDADNQATTGAQTYANATGDCVADEVTYYSAAFYDWFESNDGHCDTYVSEDCGTCSGVEGYTATQCAAMSGTWVPGTGSAWAYFTASYGDYTSTISQADADAQAQAAAQAAANAAECACNSVPQ